MTKGQEEAVEEFFGWENVQLEKKRWEKEAGEVKNEYKLSNTNK